MRRLLYQWSWIFLFHFIVLDILAGPTKKESKWSWLKKNCSLIVASNHKQFPHPTEFITLSILMSDPLPATTVEMQQRLYAPSATSTSFDTQLRRLIEQGDVENSDDQLRITETGRKRADSCVQFYTRAYNEGNKLRPKSLHADTEKNAKPIQFRSFDLLTKIEFALVNLVAYEGSDLHAVFVKLLSLNISVVNQNALTDIINRLRSQNLLRTEPEDAQLVRSNPESLKNVTVKTTEACETKRNHTYRFFTQSF